MPMYLPEILFVLVLGTLMHFMYSWSGKNPFVGLIAPVNESVWEHMKLLFFPMLLTGLWLLRHETDPCRISAFHAGLLLGTGLIAGIHYAYVKALGQSYLILDIADFILSVLLAFGFFRFFSSSCLLGKLNPITSIAVFLMLICFFIFTYHPPDLPIFQEPAK